MCYTRFSIRLSFKPVTRQTRWLETGVEARRDNLHRSDATEIYYAIFERNGKQIHL